MSGPPPKLQGERRRRNAPAGGEWIELAPLAAPVLPPLPEGEWSDRTRSAWDAWREDPATGQYTPADVAFALDTIHLHEQSVRERKVALWGELRLRLDTLGLSAKGKRALRWRVPSTDEAPPRGASPRHGSSARRRRLMAVDPSISRDGAA